MSAELMVHSDVFDLSGEVDDLALLARRSGPDSAFLRSDGTHVLGRRSVLALHPYLEFRYEAPRLTLSRYPGPTDTRETRDPLPVLEALLGAHRGEIHSAPYAAGALGYVSYDFNRCLERIESPIDTSDMRIPDILFRFFRIFLVRDHRRRRTTAYLTGIGDTPVEARRDLHACRRRLEEVLAAPAPSPGVYSSRPSEIRMAISRDEYLDRIRQIRDYIRRGHVYQVNFSHLFEMEWDAGGLAILDRLFAVNPVPFAAWFPWGSREVVSLSPECFLCRRGDRLATFPIKGTRPRGDTAAADRHLVEDLLAAAKDGAELAMIVDLERNDLGRICRGGSVQVARHRLLDTFHTLHHAYSVVTGRLAAGHGLTDILRATFPGGSITGVPKIRCMQIIRELEGDTRDIYTGCLGHLHLTGDLTLNIAIRTLLKEGPRIRFRMGGGIVYDSDPAAEYEETLHKARAFYLACAGATATRPLSMKGTENHSPPEERSSHDNRR